MKSRLLYFRRSYFNLACLVTLAEQSLACQFVTNVSCHVAAHANPLNSAC